MAHLYATKKILRGQEVIDPKVEPVFEANGDVAKQLDGLKSARPATKAEIDAYKAREAKRNGGTYVPPVAETATPAVVDKSPQPASGNSNDPQSAPKGKAE